MRNWLLHIVCIITLKVNCCSNLIANYRQLTFFVTSFDFLQLVLDKRKHTLCIALLSSFLCVFILYAFPILLLDYWYLWIKREIPTKYWNGALGKGQRRRKKEGWREENSTK